MNKALSGRYFAATRKLRACHRELTAIGDATEALNPQLSRRLAILAMRLGALLAYDANEIVDILAESREAALKKQARAKKKNRRAG